MRLVFHLLCSVTLLAANSVEAQSRRASDWQVFKVPDYGTRLEYPASIFSAAGQGETVVGQRFEMRMVGQCCPSTPARMKTAIHPRVIPRRICGNRDHNTNGSLVCDFDGAGRDNSYSRCNFSRSARRAIHCFDLVYPRAEKRAWDPVVTRISLSLRPLER
jgi:hypothetical protein